ncbi:hypothetical protein [Fibrobacter sp.]|uniref:hypothetical protein n=1 Tax=Fibrobacter sp. TaxID=35828 RepID=UPI0038908C6B
MDHEYSISGRLRVDDAELALSVLDCREFAIDDIVFLLSAAGVNEIQISLRDKSMAVSISDDKISTCCADLSRRFACRVRMEKLHEEYGNANVFNGGSDYEVVCADSLVCEYDNGREIVFRKQSV